MWQGNTGETPRKTYPDFVSLTTKPTWSDRERELGTPAVGGKGQITSATMENKVILFELFSPNFLKILFIGETFHEVLKTLYIRGHIAYTIILRENLCHSRDSNHRSPVLRTSALTN